MPYHIVKTRLNPPGYKVQKISDKTYISTYDMSYEKAKEQLAAIILKESKKITKLYKKNNK